MDRPPEPKETEQPKPEVSSEEKGPSAPSETEMSRERLVRSIDSRVNCAMGIKSTVESIEDLDLEREAANQQLHESLVKLVNESFPDDNAKRDEFFRLQEQSESIAEDLAMKTMELNRLKRSGADEEEIGWVEKEKAALEKRGRDVDDAMAEIRQDLEFVDRMIGLTEALKKKGEAVEKYREQEGGQEAVLADIRQLYPAISEEDIMKVEFRSYSVSVFIKRKELTDAFNQETGYDVAVVEGMHLRDTPINIIAYDDDKTEEDYQLWLVHEGTHNMVESLFEEQDLFAEVGDPVALAAELNVDDVGNVSIEQGGEKFDVDPSPEKVMSALKEEVLGHVEVLEMLWSRESDDIRAMTESGSQDQRFDLTCGSYSTAGEAARQYREALRNISQDGSRSDEERRYAADAESAFIGQFMRMNDGLKRGFELARSIGPEAQGAVHAFAAVMEPSKYRHLPWYLKQRYPEKA